MSADLSDNFNRSEIKAGAGLAHKAGDTLVWLNRIEVEQVPDECPDLSHLEDTNGKTPNEIEQDTKRLQSYGRSWSCVGIRATAAIYTSGDGGKNWLCNEVQSGGLWGMEDDSEPSYFGEIAREELSELAIVLRALGFSDAEIMREARKAGEAFGNGAEKVELT